MSALLQLGAVLNQAELAMLVRVRERVKPQECGIWNAFGAERMEFSYHVPGQAIVSAARLLKRGEVWDCFDLTADNFVIGTYHFEDAVKAVEDWFSVIEETQPEQSAGAGA